ncbi:acyl-CoA dehydrogenase family protein [Symmachiella dynata]|uniref:acyl-CoA dehydrogenase family protein n=1 Tax=Symmachiella dynata TaxID=2527995 RepID=UPI0030ED4747
MASNSPPTTQPIEPLLKRLAETTGELDQQQIWPSEQLRWLDEAGVLGWTVPRTYGGSEISAAELVAGYEQLAAACLTTTFVLTQRNGAIQRIAGSDNECVRDTLLPGLVHADIFATVGISHLTTSRQHVAKPVVSVRESAAGFVFEGFMPWVTGARAADYIVSGGTLEDGRQVLAAIKTDHPGVQPQDPVSLMALSASQTGAVKLNDVEVPSDMLIAGPVEQVMKQTSGGAGSFTTSALALGVSNAAVSSLANEASRRPDLTEVHEQFAVATTQLSEDLHAATRGEASAEHTAESLRRRANSLALRSTQAVLTATKGAGYVSGHPAERAVREAMFFLVWSCPQPVAAAALKEFACTMEG